MSVDFARMQEVFLAAVERQRPDDRAAYLDQACAGDDTLRRQVNLLLKAHAEAGSVPGAPALESVTAQYPNATDLAGTVIGPYKLIEQIGEGGMGTVWMAQQTEPVKRVVAVKLIKPGMDSRQIIARFEAERQALALMDHANIARVLDAGTTAAGAPYFVMDLVKGVPITQYCDEHHLTPRQRLELFVPVCQAVQHAHQKGIIHRDLKPSNVLVALYDGKPVPKVIDFGVAKAAGQTLTDKTLVTGFGNIVGTLEYLAPEQAELNQLDIDTRSDIYSLGVLLYELLTGSPPFSRKELEEAGVLEMLRVIREQEPSKPSTKLSTTEGLATLAANRGTEPSKLTRLLRGELDWIVMKALEKDRNRRYQTANAFVADVGRYLADEQVLACPPSAWYRFRKFAWRNRRGLATAAVVGLALLVALTAVAGSVGWAVRGRAAQVERDVAGALQEARSLGDRAAALTDKPDQWEVTLTAALAAINRAEALVAQDHRTLDSTLKHQVQEVQARLEADEKDRRFIACFDESQAQRATVDVVRSRFHKERGQILLKNGFEEYGIPFGTMRAEEVVARLQQRPRVIQDQLVTALYVCFHRLDPEESKAVAPWFNSVIRHADTDPWRRGVMQAMRSRDVKAVTKLFQEVEPEQQPAAFLIFVARGLPRELEAVKLLLLGKTQQAYPGDFWANHSLAFELHFAQRPQVTQAIRYYTAALALRPRNTGVLLNLGTALSDTNDLDGAIAAYRQVIAIDPNYTAAHINLGVVLARKGDLQGALSELRLALALDPRSAEAHFNLGATLREMGDRDGACTAYRDALRIAPKHNGASTNLGLTLREQGLFAESLTAFKEGEQSLAGNHPQRDFILKMIREGELLLELDRKLPGIVEGREKPGDATEQLQYAQVSLYKGLYHTASRLFGAALSAEPQLVQEQWHSHRFEAACAAAMAGTGQGAQAPLLDDPERTRWRKQAISWLKEDLAVCAKELETAKTEDRPRLRQQLAKWQLNPELARLRDPTTLAELPEAEQEACRALWAEVVRLLTEKD